MTTLTAYYIFFYGLAAIIGGNIGYRKKKSLASLVSGAVFGGALSVAAIGIYTHKEWGVILAALLSVFLLIFFSIRYMKSAERPFMPAGLMTIMGAIALILIFLTFGKV